MNTNLVYWWHQYIKTGTYKVGINHVNPFEIGFKDLLDILVSGEGTGANWKGIKLCYGDIVIYEY